MICNITVIKQAYHVVFVTIYEVPTLFLCEVFSGKHELGECNAEGVEVNVALKLSKSDYYLEIPLTNGD